MMRGHVDEHLLPILEYILETRTYNPGSYENPYSGEICDLEINICHLQIPECSLGSSQLVDNMALGKSTRASRKRKICLN